MKRAFMSHSLPPARELQPYDEAEAQEEQDRPRAATGPWGRRWRRHGRHRRRSNHRRPPERLTRGRTPLPVLRRRLLTALGLRRGRPKELLGGWVGRRQLRGLAL